MNPIKNRLTRLNVSSTDLRFTLPFAVFNGLLGLMGSGFNPFIALTAATTGALAGFGLDFIKVLHGRRSRLNGLEHGNVPFLGPLLPLRRIPAAAVVMYAAGTLLSGVATSFEPSLGNWMADAALHAVTTGVAFGVGGVLGSEYLYATKSKPWHGIV